MQEGLKSNRESQGDSTSTFSTFPTNNTLTEVTENHPEKPDLKTEVLEEVKAPKFVVKLKPPKLSDNLKKSKTQKPRFKPENNLKITSMFKSLTKNQKPCSIPTQNGNTAERVSPTPDLSMGRNNKRVDQKSLHKGVGVSDTTEKDQCELLRLESSYLPTVATQESSVNPLRPIEIINLPDTSQTV